MHSIRTIWREPAYVLALLAVLAVYGYNRTFVDPVNFEGYLVATFANASIFLIFACPVASASAAIAASRARRAGVWASPVVRSRMRITLRLLLASFIGGVGVQAVGLLLLMDASWGAPGRIPLEIPLVWLSILIFHVALGYLLGRFLPLAASVPLAIFASYSWLGFTWSVSYFPLRYLSGLVISACCSADLTLDGRAVVSVLVFSIFMSAALLVVATVPAQRARWRVRLAMGVAAVTCAVLAVTGGLGVAKDVGPHPVAPRPHADLVCEGAMPEVCVYPEQLRYTDPRPTLRKAYLNLKNSGLSLPEAVTASNRPEDVSSLRVVLPPRPTTEQLVYTVAAALLPADVAPYCEDGSDYPARVNVAAVSLWWLQSVAGAGLIDDATIDTGGVSSDAGDLISRFSRLSERQQHDWYVSAAPTLRDCAVAPMEVPGP